jgi:hypothetical protein
MFNKSNIKIDLDHLHDIIDDKSDEYLGSLLILDKLYTHSLLGKNSYEVLLKSLLNNLNGNSIFKGYERGYFSIKNIIDLITTIPNDVIENELLVSFINYNIEVLNIKELSDIDFFIKFNKYGIDLNDMLPILRDNFEDLEIIDFLQDNRLETNIFNYDENISEGYILENSLLDLVIDNIEYDEVIKVVNYYQLSNSKGNRSERNNITSNYIWNALLIQNQVIAEFKDLDQILEDGFFLLNLVEESDEYLKNNRPFTNKDFLLFDLLLVSKDKVAIDDSDIKFIESSLVDIKLDDKAKYDILRDFKDKDVSSTTLIDYILKDKKDINNKIAFINQITTKSLLQNISNRSKEMKSIDLR